MCLYFLPGLLDIIPSGHVAYFFVPHIYWESHVCCIFIVTLDV